VQHQQGNTKHILIAQVWDGLNFIFEKVIEALFIA
jgi:hypothetical protein